MTHLNPQDMTREELIEALVIARELTVEQHHAKLNAIDTADRLRCRVSELEGDADHDAALIEQLRRARSHSMGQTVLLRHRLAAAAQKLDRLRKMRRGEVAA